MATVYNKANDPYGSYAVGPDTIGRNSTVVVPSDTVDFATYPKDIVVANGGNLVVLPLYAADDGNHLVTFTGASVQFVVPFRVRRVIATGTTATVVTIDDN